MDINVNNVKIHYEVLGEGKEIILLNPNSVNTNFMRPIANILKKDFKVYLVDRRGCGKSQRDCHLSYEESAKDIYELIVRLGLNRPYVLGSSGGASVALNLCIMYPELVSKLVLCSPIARMSTIKDGGLHKIFQIFWFPGKKDTLKFVKLNNEARDLLSVDLSKITAKTLIVKGGKKDIVKDEEAEYIKENIKGARMVVLESESHSSYMLNVKWYDTLKSFLQND